jgi:hypothetical protein
MANVPADNTQSVRPERELVAHKDLGFDLQNPRFIGRVLKDEVEIIQYLYDTMDVDELIQSILSAGWIDFEPFIVLREENVVLEGNRRLAALRIITREDIRTALKIRLPAIKDPKQPPDVVRVRWVDSRAQGRDFIGYKHIKGPLKWDALAKAQYAATWFQDGGDIGTISSTLGDSHNTVRRLVTGWLALQQAKNDGFDPSQISKKSFAFSHLYTALSRSAVKEMLGLDLQDPSKDLKENPIPTEHREDLATLMSWLYGQEQKGEPTLIESQNPNLNQLSRVLANPEAKLMLVSTRNLQAAYERVDPPSSRFEEALMVAAKKCEDVMSLSGFYEGNATLLQIAEGMRRTTSSLLVVMRDRVKAKTE